MNELEQLDAECVADMVSDSPITFGFGGVDYIGTLGARDTATILMEGGVVNQQEFRLLVPIAQFGESARPSERSIITVCLRADGIPCIADEVVTRVNARIVAIGRAGGGLTYTISTAQKG